jgi:WD40 repeat protein
MEQEAKERKKRELEERRARLEKMRAARVAKSKEQEEKLRAKKADKEMADNRFVQDILNRQPSPTRAPAPAAAEETVSSAAAVEPSSLPPLLAAAAAAAAASKLPQMPPAKVPTEVLAPPPPPPVLSYAQSTQTEPGELDSDNDDDAVAAGAVDANADAKAESDAEALQQNSSADVDVSGGNKRGSAAAVDEDWGGGDGSEPTVAALSEATRREIMESSTFRAFVAGKARVVERALGEALLFDCTDDYLGIPDLDAPEELRDEAYCGSRLGGGLADAESDGAGEDKRNGIDRNAIQYQLKPHVRFQGRAKHFKPPHQPWSSDSSDDSEKRPVSDLQWAPHHPELIAVAYGASDGRSIGGGGDDGRRSSPYKIGRNIESDGVVLLWSIVTPDKPAKRLSCHSPVLSVQFQESNPALVIGGTYSGQIVLWDTRKPSSLPVRRTAHGGESHTHPVYCMAQRSSSGGLAAYNPADHAPGSFGLGVEVFGRGATKKDGPSFSQSNQATTLVTASTDGVLSEWSMDNLLHPSERVVLRYKETGTKCGALGNSSVGGQFPVPISAFGLVSGSSVANRDIFTSSASSSALKSRCCDYVFVGAESGDLCIAELGGAYSSVLKKETRGLLPASQRIGRAHYGMVTSLNVHPDNCFPSKKGGLDEDDSDDLFGSSSLCGDSCSKYHHLVLTVGMDWSTCLWSVSMPPPNRENKLASSITSKVGPCIRSSGDGKPLCSFRGAYDYVCDVEWCPTHPAVFATVDSLGQLNLWDLSHSADEPRIPPLPVSNVFHATEARGPKKIPGDGNDPAPEDGNEKERKDDIKEISAVPLSKVNWSRDGRRLATGDMDGNVFVFAARGISEPQEGDEAAFDSFLARLNVLRE